MRGFLRNSLTWPASTPRLNRAHPLFNQQHFNFAGVAGLSGGMQDLVTGTIATDASVTTGVDENGPYIFNNTTTGGLTFTGASGTNNFFAMGCIFKFVTNQRQWIMAISSNTGFWINAGTINFEIANGSRLAVPIIINHTYMLVFCNAVGTAGVNNVFGCYDMTAGRLAYPLTSGSASSGAPAVTPISILLPYAATAALNRIYCAFVSASVNTPPSTVNPPTFYSVDQVAQAFSDPWSLLYG